MFSIFSFSILSLNLVACGEEEVPSYSKETEPTVDWDISIEEPSTEPSTEPRCRIRKMGHRKRQSLQLSYHN